MLPVLRSSPWVPSWGVFLILAFALGWWLARRRARRMGMPTWQIDWLVPLLLYGAAVGAALAGRLSQSLTDGGNDRLLYGGLLAAGGVAVAYARLARLPLGRLADAFALGLPAGIALLRVGCFLGGCCWGDICAPPDRLAVVADPAWRSQVQTFPSLCGGNWPLRVTFPAGSPAYGQHLTVGLLRLDADRSLPVHPVQLYEAAACLVLLALLTVMDGRWRCWGESFLVFGLSYAAIRFVVEWFRADTRPVAGNLTAAQLVSFACAGVCLVLWSVLRRRARTGQAERNRRLAGQEQQMVL